MSKKASIILLLIFLVSTFLRIGMVIHNRQANDAHEVVISRILQTEKLPKKSDCWECFQPKLFHYTTAKIIEIFVSDKAHQVSFIPLAAIFMNFILGLIILIVIGYFIIKLPINNETLKIIAFGLVALNPKLIGINSQYTNDTFAILFSTLALFFTYKFHQKPKWFTFLLTIIFCVLAVSSKTNTWVTCIAIMVSFLIKAWVEQKRTFSIVLLGVSVFVSVVGISIINPLNQYLFNYKKYGSPLLLNMEKAPFPDFWNKTISNRPGILSISDGLFTFKFFDLLKHPSIRNDSDNYSPNRTSLWTQIYGRSQSVHFDNWPPSWSANEDKGFNLTRSIFVFGLLPTSLLLIGFALDLFDTIKSILSRKIDLARSRSYGLFSITFVGYLLFIMLYAVTYRDYSVMKAIFIYPAIFCFPWFFIRACEYIRNRIRGEKIWLLYGFAVWLVILFGLYISDILTMILLIRSRMSS